MAAKIVGWQRLADRVHDRVSGIIDRKDIYDAVKVVTRELSQAMIADEQVRVKNFGTLVPHVLGSHTVRHVLTGQLVQARRSRTVRFYPHAALVRLLKERRGNFT